MIVVAVALTLMVTFERVLTAPCRWCTTCRAETCYDQSPLVVQTNCTLKRCLRKSPWHHISMATCKVANISNLAYGNDISWISVRFQIPWITFQVLQKFRQKPCFNWDVCSGNGQHHRNHCAHKVKYCSVAYCHQPSKSLDKKKVQTHTEECPVLIY